MVDEIAASRQAQIVELGGLKLLLPLTQSRDVEVQRLAVHALANLSVNGELTIKTGQTKYQLYYGGTFYRSVGCLYSCLPGFMSLVNFRMGSVYLVLLEP